MLESEDGNRRNCCLCCTTLGNEKRLQEYLCYASAALTFIIMLKCCNLMSLGLRTRIRR